MIWARALWRAVNVAAQTAPPPPIRAPAKAEKPLFCGSGLIATRLSISHIRDDDPVGLGCGVDCGPGEALDDAVELETAIEAVGEAGQVGLGVLRADVVVGAGQRRLDVAERGVDPAERRPARGPLTRAGHDREVLAPGLLDRRPAGQPVADHGGAGLDRGLGQLLDLPLAEALDHREPQPLGPPLGRGLDRGDDGRLAGRAPAPLAARALAAEVGVVHLDPAGELRLPHPARGPRPHQLVLHQPGRGLPHPEPPRQLDRADPVLALGQVVDGREPGRERQLGVLEHGAGGERELLLAPVALEDLAGLERAEAAVAAGRAGQPLPPAHREQRLAARRLGAEPLPERGLAQAPHRAPQPVRRCHPAPSPALEPARILDRTGMGVMDNQVPYLHLQAATVVGRGISLWMAIQDPSQLEATYGYENAMTILANCRAHLRYRPALYKTAKEISEWLGYKSEFAHSKSLHKGEEFSEEEAETAVHNMTPQEVKGLDDEDIFIDFDNKRPIQAKRIDIRNYPELLAMTEISSPALLPIPDIPDTEGQGREDTQLGYISPD